MKTTPALALLLLALGAAGQDPPPAREPFFRTLLESRPFHLKNEFDMLGTAFEIGGVTTDRCSAADALKRVQAWLDGAGAPDALAALKGAGMKAAELAGIAGAAAAKGSLTLAIAALKRAIDLEPENPGALANLAAALSSVGLCAEAISLAEAAEALAGKKTGAMGLPLRCIALNARGHSLIRQGKPADAVKPLREAVELGGALASDAARNLALALKKSGEEEEAKKFFLMACWRRSAVQPVCTGGKSRKPGDPPPQPFDEGVSTHAPISRIFDLSRGTEGKFPAFKHPHNLAELKTFEKFLKREEAAKSAFLKTPSPRNTKITTLADRGAFHVYTLIKTIDSDPDIKPLRQEMDAGRKELSRQIGILRKRCGEQYQELLKSDLKGEAFNARHLAIANEFITAAHGPCNAYEPLVRKYWATCRKYQTGLASNIHAPDWHALAVHAITDNMHMRWASDLLYPIWSSYGPDIGATAKEGELEVPDAPEDEKTPRCPGLGMEVSAGPLSFSMSCESVGLELASEGILKGFVSLEAKWSGEMTVYAGAKLEASVKGVGMNVHDGFYVTGDKNGLKDAGFRVGFEAFSESSGVKVKTTLDQMDFSLMPRAP